jgi:hypothetical protein
MPKEDNTPLEPTNHTPLFDWDVRSGNHPQVGDVTLITLQGAGIDPVTYTMTRSVGLAIAEKLEGVSSPRDAIPE